VILRGCRIVTMDATRRVMDGDVVVADGRIKAVGGRRSAKTDTKILDCRGLVIIPGLIQAHVHLCQTLFRGLADDLPLQDWLVRRIWPLEAAHTADSVYWSAMLGAAELLLGGTTAILDMETVRHTGAAFEALETIGLRATVGKCLMDAEAAPVALRESTDAALQEADDLRVRWHGRARDRLRWCYAPRFAPSCTGSLLRAVSDLAAQHDTQVHTHAAETPLELELVKRATGHDEIAYLDSMGIAGPRATLAHCVWVDRDGIRRLASHGTNIAHCPSSNLKLGSGIAPIAEYRRLGLRVALGADGAPCNNRLSPLTELRTAALLQALAAGPGQWPAAAALWTATRGGALALGLDHRVGSLRPGLRADVCLYDLDDPSLWPGGDFASRLVWAADERQLTDVLLGGRFVVRQGQPCAFDAAAVAARAVAARDRVLARAGLAR
jgi:cytosine/adenosine deaminase-related metal-dependent hydrolase